MVGDVCVSSVVYDLFFLRHSLPQAHSLRTWAEWWEQKSQRITQVTLTKKSKQGKNNVKRQFSFFRSRYVIIWISAVPVEASEDWNVENQICILNSLLKTGAFSYIYPPWKFVIEAINLQCTLIMQETQKQRGEGFKNEPQRLSANSNLGLLLG